jgi:hypothetical protein
MNTSEPFQRLAAWRQTDESVLVYPVSHTRLKPGANEIAGLAAGNRVAAQAALRGLPAGQEQGRVSTL